MKKKFAKKLNLKKETISVLQEYEMRSIKAASIFLDTCNCDTASCSILGPCCDPKIKKLAIEEEVIS